MKILFHFIFLLISLNSSFAQSIKIPSKNIKAILKETSEQLNQISSISYNLKRELNYSSENYHNISEWNSYYYFDSKISILGFIYQVNDSTSSLFFNGTEKFDLNKSNKTILINNKPNINDFSSQSHLYNSIVTLRNILPKIINEDNPNMDIKDTTINSNQFQIITINLGKRRIQNLGNEFDKMNTSYNFIYKITIDKASKFPVEILQKNDLNSDFIKTTFTNINPSPLKPTENSWYYSTYQPEFNNLTSKETLKLISIGSFAPDWVLPYYNKDEVISLSKLKGKVVLLDFWFKNCGPCIESVPHLNELRKKFNNDNFEIIAINTWDSRNDIARFCDKHQVQYNVLYDGKKIADDYGINSFPTLVLINKNGKIVYVGGFDKTKIEALIKSAI